jgi:anti-sigma B factor antagonist
MSQRGALTSRGRAAHYEFGSTVTGSPVTAHLPDLVFPVSLPIPEYAMWVDSLRCELVRPERGPTLIVHGEIDMATEDQFRDALGEVVACCGPRVFVDLAGVTFMGSTGLNALVQAKARAEPSTDIVILNPSSMCARTLAITALDTRFTIEHDDDSIDQVAS